MVKNGTEMKTMPKTIEDYAKAIENVTKTSENVAKTIEHDAETKACEFDSNCRAP